MGFPEGSLTKDEVVLSHLRPHWRILILPATYLVVIAFATLFVWIAWADGFWGHKLLVVLLVAGSIFLARFSVWPVLDWQSRHFVFTNERLLLREGVLKRELRDIPLTKINDVAAKQSIIDLPFGSGALVLGAGVVWRLEHIPNVIKTQVLVNELIQDKGHKRGIDAQGLEQQLKKAPTQSGPEIAVPGQRLPEPESEPGSPSDPESDQHTVSSPPSEPRGPA